jgi:hypothetical protein
MAHRSGLEQDGERVGRRLPRALLWADIASLSVAFLIAELLFGRVSRITHAPIGPEYAAFVLGLFGWVLVAELFGLYDPDRSGHLRIAEFFAVFYLVSVGTWLIYMGLRVTGVAEPSFHKLLTFWALAVVLVTLNRAIAYTNQRRST